MCFQTWVSLNFFCQNCTGAKAVFNNSFNKNIKMCLRKGFVKVHKNTSHRETKQTHFHSALRHSFTRQGTGIQWTNQRTLKKAQIESLEDQSQLNSGFQGLITENYDQSKNSSTHQEEEWTNQRQQSEAIPFNKKTFTLDCPMWFILWLMSCFEFNSHSFQVLIATSKLIIKNFKPQIYDFQFGFYVLSW